MGRMASEVSQASWWQVGFLVGLGGHSGNPAALLTSGAYTAFAYDYDPYGVPALTANSGGLGTSQNPYAFKAGIQDRVTGWVKYGQRWYNPTDGRWTQQNTLDAPLNPKNANRYAFAACGGINNSDATGRDAEGCAWAQGFLVVFAIGFVATAPVDGPVGIAAGIGILTALAGGAGAGADYVAQC